MSTLIGKKRKEFSISAVLFVILLLVTVIMIIPYIWMLSTSLKIGKNIFTEKIEFIPNPLTWVHYSNIIVESNIFGAFWNTAKIFLIVIPVGMFTTSLASFAFAKLRFKGKKLAFTLLLATMMIPFPVVMLPQYIFYAAVGIRDSYLPLIIPGCLGNISAMFFIIQFLKSTPDALLDAAKIDGAGYFKTYLSIILPLIKPALATQAIFWFMAIWNDLLGPIIYLDSVEKYTVTATLASLNTQNNSLSAVADVMAGSVLASLPLLVVYCIFQKQIVNSLAFSGVKG